MQAKRNKDDRSAQAVQDEASLSPAVTTAGFSMAPRSQVGNVHGSHSVAATIRPPEMRMTAITREWLSWDDYSDKFEREGPFRGNTHECGVLQDLLTSIAAISEYYVCGTSVRLFPILLAEKRADLHKKTPSISKSRLKKRHYQICLKHFQNIRSITAATPHIRSRINR